MNLPLQGRIRIHILYYGSKDPDPYKKINPNPWLKHSYLNFFLNESLSYLLFIPGAELEGSPPASLIQSCSGARWRIRPLQFVSDLGVFVRPSHFGEQSHLEKTFLNNCGKRTENQIYIKVLCCLGR